MDKLRQIIEARCTHAEIACERVFDSDETRNHLCRMSGGHPRHLLMFIQAASSAVDALPITRAAADKAVRNYANSLLREIPDDFWPKLSGFAAPQRDIPKNDQHQQMLLLLHIFEYMNDEPWYEVNPVIRTLHRFQSAG